MNQNTIIHSILHQNQNFQSHKQHIRSTSSTSKPNIDQIPQSISQRLSIRSSQFQVNNLDQGNIIQIKRNFYQQMLKINTIYNAQEQIFSNFMVQMQIAELQVFEQITNGNYEKVVKLFFDYPLPSNLKKRKNNSCNNLLHQSIKYENLQLIDFFMKKNPKLINETNNYGKTPLHFYLIYNSKTLIFFLQKWKIQIDWNMKDLLGNTYLHYCYFYNLDKQIKLIFEKKITDCTNDLGMKSYQCLMGNNVSKKFKYSVQNGSCRIIKGYIKKTARQINLEKMYNKFSKMIEVKQFSNTQDQNIQNSMHSISLDNFQIHQKLGSGGFTQVFKVKYIPSQKFYALKVFQKWKLDYKTLKYFKNQKNILKKFTHPYLIKMYCSFQNQYFLFLVLQLCQAGTLRQYIYKNPQIIKQQQIKFYICQLISVLSYLHNKNIIHRDLKPQNIALDQQGHIKLIDFGLAKNLKKNVTRTICGTQQYLPPEVLNCQQYTYTVDWYMLGIIIYEMIYKTTPYRGLQNRQQNIKVNYPFGISQQLQDLLMKLLNCKKDERIGSKYDAIQIMEHSWFNNINWTTIPKRFHNLDKYKKHYEKLEVYQGIPEYFQRSKILEIDNQFLEVNQWDCLVRTL